MNLTDDLKRRFKVLVADRSGLYFKDHDMRNLEDAVQNRMKVRGFTAALLYYKFLTEADQREDEFRELVNLLTIHHTYFFRNGPHFWAMRHKIQHQKFIDSVTKFREELNAKKSGVSQEVLDFLKTWLSSHILVQDMKYGVFLMKKGLPKIMINEERLAPVLKIGFRLFVDTVTFLS